MLTYRLHLIATLFVVAFGTIAAYRAQLLIWMLAGSLPLIMMFVWMSVAGQGTVGGFDADDFVQYFLLVFVVRQIVNVWVVYDVDSSIRRGTLSQQLLRPVDPIWNYAVDNLATNLTRLPLVTTVALVGLWLADAAGNLPLANIPLFMMAVALAWTMYFNLSYAIAMAAFWTEHVVALAAANYTIGMIVSGALFPLSLMPATVASILAFTPYPYLVGFPVELMRGNLSGGDIVDGFLIQAAWIVVLALGQRMLWRLGLRRYSAVGA